MNAEHKWTPSKEKRWCYPGERWLECQECGVELMFASGSEVPVAVQWDPVGDCTEEKRELYRLSICRLVLES